METQSNPHDDDMPVEIDFSKGARGKFSKPGMTLNLPMSKAVSTSTVLSIDEGSRVLGMARLVSQVQAVLDESGDPKGFDAAAWVARWLERPVQAIGGRRPAELMDTSEGQALVSSIVARMQSGTYS